MVAATLIRSSGQSIPWASEFGTIVFDSAGGVALDDDGSVYVVGHTMGVFPGQNLPGGSRDALVRKHDQDGNELWTRQFGAQGADRARAAAVDGDGKLFVVGETAGPFPGKIRVGGFSDAYLRKYDGNGTGLWTRRFGKGELARANGVDVDSANNVYVVGQTEGALPGQVSSGSNDAFVRKYDGDGNVLWTHQFGGQGGDFALDVAVDRAPDAYVVGWINSESHGQPIVMDAFVNKYSTDGNELWKRQFGTQKFDRATSVAVDDDGNIYAAGCTCGEFPGQTEIECTDAFVRRYDTAGNELWTRQFGTAREDRALGVSVDREGTLYVVGWTEGTFPAQTHLGKRPAVVHKDGFVRAYDSAGNDLWTHQFGNELAQSGNDVIAEREGELYVVGHTIGSLNGPAHRGALDAFVMKFSVDSPPNPLMTPASAKSVPDQAQLRPLAASATEITSKPRTPTASPRSTPASVLGPTPPVDAQSTPSGGCSAPPSNGAAVQSSWLLLGLIWPGLIVARSRPK